MSWVVTPQLKSVDGVPIGTAYGGGYVAGYISHTADGVPTHALIVAPRATGASGTGYTLTTNYQWKTADTATAGATSVFDGVANQNAIVTAGLADHPAANFCVGLSIGGFTDWYLPARDELHIAYFNLKPGTTNNNTGAGTNVYAVPQRNSNYTLGYPKQTDLIAFNTSQESFVASNHQSSTGSTSANNWVVAFNTGAQTGSSKSAALPVRAFRRIAL